jgi:hypothetical protein
MKHALSIVTMQATFTRIHQLHTQARELLRALTKAIKHLGMPAAVTNPIE